MRNNVILYVVLSLLSLSACVDTTADPQLAGRTFFDLNAYFAQEVDQVATLGRFQKTVTVNQGKPEEKLLDSLDLDAEFKAFRDADINRVGWMDEYEVDSMLNTEGMLAQLTYTAKSEKLNTKLLSISYQQGKVSKIEVEIGSESMIASMSKRLQYIPHQGYSIESQQQTSGSDPFLLKLEVAFLQ